MMHTSLYFSRIEEERGSNNMESSSIFDQFPVTQGDDQEVVTFEGESQVSGGTDQTTAVDCQEEYCLEDEEGAAPGGAAAAEGRGDEAKPSLYSLLLKLIKQEEENTAFLKRIAVKPYEAQASIGLPLCQCNVILLFILSYSYHVHPFLSCRQGPLRYQGRQNG